jgi:hypothetical protein
VIVLTGLGGNDVRVYPKALGGVVILIVGAVAPVPATVVGGAVVMAVLVVWMVLAVPTAEPSPRSGAPGGEVD